ncbi:MAG: NAD(P)H-dependent glycerol-3-phosphate dehydrogenase, partial [Pseudomonadota bacterium]
MTFQRFAVLGSGAWGTALAATLQNAGRNVVIWGRDPDVIASLKAGNGNPAYLPDIKLPAFEATTDMAALGTLDACLAVVPAQTSRAVFEAAAPFLSPGLPVLLCAKGIEHTRHSLMTDVLAETVPESRPCVLSGPSFAHDVARGLPTAVTLACADRPTGEALSNAIGSPTFRPYWVSDLVGAEVGGAVKNVLAIACGIVDGLALGRSAHAALIARGFAELRRLALAMGAEETTLSGLCGLGDL